MRNGDGACQSNPEMDVVRHTARAIGFASGVPRHRGKIGVEMWTQLFVKAWKTILRAEDDVDDDEAQGLRHGKAVGESSIVARLNRAVGPSGLWGNFLGRCPRLI